MKKKILLHNRSVEYETRKSLRAKRLRIAVFYNTRVIVTIPRGVRSKIVEKYIIKKSKWIVSKIDFYSSLPLYKSLKLKQEDYFKYKGRAFEIAQTQINYFNKYYDYNYKEILIKNYKTRWGTCSRNGNLSFNFRITHLPSDIRDYIIVHELCHIKESNHSRKFWNLVAKSIPNYKKSIEDLNVKGLFLS